MFLLLVVGKPDGRSIVMIVALLVTVSACIGFMLFGWFSHMLPQLRLKMGQVGLLLPLTCVTNSYDRSFHSTSEPYFVCLTIAFWLRCEYKPHYYTIAFVARTTVHCIAFVSIKPHDYHSLQYGCMTTLCVSDVSIISISFAAIPYILTDKRRWCGS